MEMAEVAEQVVRATYAEGTVGWCGSGIEAVGDRLDALHEACLRQGVQLAVLVGRKTGFLSTWLVTEDTRHLGHNQRINHRKMMEHLRPGAQGRGHIVEIVGVRGGA